jgi:branched-chain amino acid transport system substrate-binding protein
VEARAAEAVEAGARLALADAGGRAGGRDVRFVRLDDTDPAGTGPTWDPEHVQANAGRAVADPTTIAYIGELDEGGSAVSVPVTNDAGLLQVSPADGLTTLTRDQPGAATGTGPARYYPSGKRTFIRLVPPDALQAAGLVKWARERGARRLTIVQDDQVFGRVLAQQAAVAAERAGVTVTGLVEPHDDPATFPDFARKVADQRPDAVIYTGLGDANAGPLLAAIERADPAVRLYGSSSLVSAQPVPSGLPDVQVLSPLLPAARYGPRARRLLSRVKPRPEPAIAAAALYGYESMRVVLDAIASAAPDSGDRPAVARAALGAGARRSAIGDYSVLPSGDISTVRFGAYRLSAGQLEYLGERPANR